MMMPKATSHQMSRWARFSERCYRAGVHQHLQELRYGGSGVLNSMVEDLAYPLNPDLEQEFVRMLGDPGHRDISPSQVLLPVMRQSFGLDPAVAKSPEGRALKAACESCPSAGHCWHALRHGASSDQCREFCPNAAALEQEAVERG